jgi:hypothetical protein
MLEREKGEIIWCCDGCGEVLDTGTGNWDAARNVMKREGWRAKSVGDVWTHLCRNCSEPRRQHA